MSRFFDPEKSLLSLPAVQWCAGITVLIAILLAIPIIYHCWALPLDLSGDGINKFALLNKVPLATLALGLAIIGLLGANHRSEQTKRQIQRTAKQIDLTNNQIELTKGQNNFVNHFKHVEEFEKYYDSHNEKVNATYKRSLHARIFKNAKLGDFSVDSESAKILQLQSITIIHLFIRLAENSSADYNSDCIAILDQRDGVSDYFGGRSKRLGTQFKHLNESFYIPQNSIRGLYLSVREVIEFADHILQFDEKYITAACIISLLNAEVEDFPDKPFASREKFIISQWMADANPRKPEISAASLSS